MADLKKILSKLQSPDADGDGFEQLSDEEAAELHGGDNNSGCPENKGCPINSSCTPR
jgi:hypothetical protein